MTLSFVKFHILTRQAAFVSPLPNILCRGYSFKREDTPDIDPDIQNMRTKRSTNREIRFKDGFDVVFPPIGRIYDKKPFKMTLEAGKRYSWCACGFSKSQPLCDGSHKLMADRNKVKTKPNYQPLRFTVEETKEYFLCNCKQTNNRPFCDGTHRREDIQKAIK